MSVIQRCPHCGTTKSSPGECEACHEAQVRLYCTNHTPGIWLDASACPECGARLGDRVERVDRVERERPRKSAAPASRVSRAPTPTPAVRTRRASPPVAAPSPPRPRPRAREVTPDVWPTRRDETELTPRTLPWQRLLEAVVRARSTRARWAPERGGPPLGRAAGCLSRLLLVAVVLLVGLAGSVFVFGRALLGY